MIDVARDTEGIRMALEEIFEEDFVRARVERESEGASPETRERMLRQIPRRKLSPGYYVFAQHLLALDGERRAGITFRPCDLTHFEAAGFVAVVQARGGFEHRHPACTGCGARQENRFSMECVGCGAKFRRKKAR